MQCNAAKSDGRGGCERTNLPKVRSKDAGTIIESDRRNADALLRVQVRRENYAGGAGCVGAVAEETVVMSTSCDSQWVL